MNKLLIIGNSVDLLEPLKIFLEQKNYAVKILGSGDNICNEIHEYKPDLLILNIFLENEDGQEICKNLRKNIETKHLGILVFSASPAALSNYKSFHADDCLKKPFDLDTLLKKIQSMLEWTAIRKRAFQFELSSIVLPGI